MHHNRLHRLETDRRSPYSYKTAFYTGESRGTLDLGPSPLSTIQLALTLLHE